MSGLRILFEDRDLLVVDKPSGIATTSPTGRDCLAWEAREFDRVSPKMHPTSRLDAEVSGVLVFARTERGIAHALAARAEHAYRRFYLALANRVPEPDSGRWDEPIGVHPKDARRRIVDLHSVDAKPSATRYRIASRSERGVLLALRPETGRTHQLRVHASHHGAPFVGDVPYGGDKRLVAPNGRITTVARVMLHCARVELPALGGAPYRFVSPLPDDFVRAAASLGLELDPGLGDTLD